MAYRSTTDPDLTDTTHATSFRPPMTTRTYVESNVPTKSDEAGVGDRTLPPIDPTDDSSYDPFADATGDDLPYEENPPPPPAEGLTTGAKVLIGVAALGGLFLVIRAMR